MIVIIIGDAYHEKINNRLTIATAVPFPLSNTTNIVYKPAQNTAK